MILLRGQLWEKQTKGKPPSDWGNFFDYGTTPQPTQDKTDDPTPRGVPSSQQVAAASLKRNWLNEKKQLKASHEHYMKKLESQLSQQLKAREKEPEDLKSRLKQVEETSRGELDKLKAEMSSQHQREIEKLKLNQIAESRQLLSQHQSQVMLLVEKTKSSPRNPKNTWNQSYQSTVML